MTLQRADRLKEPPVVGRLYLVPAIRWSYGYYGRGEGSSDLLHGIQNHPRAMWWPVWGIKHSDEEFFNFEHQHYHIDGRFLTKHHLAELSFCAAKGRTPLQQAQASPLNHRDLAEGPPRPTLRRMRCSSSSAEWGHSDAIKVTALNKAFSGQQCGKGKRGFVCPHKHFPLGSIAAIDGIVTCPLHGMRINAATGVCIGNAA